MSSLPTIHILITLTILVRASLYTVFVLQLEQAILLLKNSYLMLTGHVTSIFIKTVNKFRGQNHIDWNVRKIN